MGAWNKLYNYIVNKLRFARYALSPKSRLYQFGSIYYGSYSNYKQDPTPMGFCMYSNNKYTHMLNTHYMNFSDKMWFGRLIYMLVKGKQIMDGRTLYIMLKQQRMSIVKTCYRVYFTGMANFKLVGHGLNTHLAGMIYSNPDQWLKTLNENTSPQEISYTSVEVAYSPTELKERIINAQNAVPITKQKVSSTGAFGKAIWKR